jgi:hypothetical protein
VQQHALRYLTPCSWLKGTNNSSSKRLDIVINKSESTAEGYRVFGSYKSGASASRCAAAIQQQVWQYLAALNSLACAPATSSIKAKQA